MAMFALILVGGLLYGRLFIKFVLAKPCTCPMRHGGPLHCAGHRSFGSGDPERIVWRNTSTDGLGRVKVWGGVSLTLLLQLPKLRSLRGIKSKRTKSPPA